MRDFVHSIMFSSFSFPFCVLFCHTLVYRNIRMPYLGDIVTQLSIVVYLSLPWYLFTLYKHYDIYTPSSFLYFYTFTLFCVFFVHVKIFSFALLRVSVHCVISFDGHSELFSTKFFSDFILFLDTYTVNFLTFFFASLVYFAICIMFSTHTFLKF